MNLEPVLQSAQQFFQRMTELSVNLRASNPVYRPIGRPTAASRASQQQIREAPFPEMATEPADRLCARIRQITEKDLLAEAYLFERRNFMRKSVIAELERRSRLLGQPVGLDLLPIADYDQLEEPEIVARLSSLSSSQLEAVSNYEKNNFRRQEIIDRAADLQRGNRPSSLPEPFPGYLALKTSPQSRPEARRSFAAASDQDLDRALLFERETRNRKVMLDYIARERRGRLRASQLGQED